MYLFDVSAPEWGRLFCAKQLVYSPQLGNALKNRG